jgi:hypothetical protein
MNTVKFSFISSFKAYFSYEIHLQSLILCFLTIWFTMLLFIEKIYQEHKPLSSTSIKLLPHMYPSFLTLYFLHFHLNDTFWSFISKLIYIFLSPNRVLQRICLDHALQDSYQSWLVSYLSNSIPSFGSVTNNFEYLTMLQCFFPQYFVSQITTPIFFVNSEIDSWQVRLFFCPTWDMQKAFT